MKWWDQMPWSYFFECWVLSQLFQFPLSPSSKGSLVPLHFLLLEWYHLHIWGCWNFWYCSLAVYPYWKQKCFKEAKTLKTDTKYIIRDAELIIITCVRAHRNSLRQKQHRNTHSERKGVGVARNEEERRKEVVKSLYRAVLPGLCLPLANYLVSFPTSELF